MKLKSFLFTIATFFFIQCNDATQNTVATQNKSETKDSCCATDSTEKKVEASMQSEITCPKCKHKKTEIMPTEVCLLSYTCEKCSTVMHPKKGDCCVFCTYGNHKCPSKQD